MSKLFHLKVFGCQMNVYDGTRISQLLTDNDFIKTDDETNADIIILHTCYIREKASEKIFSELGRIYKLYSKKNKKPPVFAVIGCVATAEKTNIFKRAPFVSIVLSSQKYHLLPELINKSLTEIEKIYNEKQLLKQGVKLKTKTKLSHIINTELSGIEKFDCLPSVKQTTTVSFIQVQEGCNKFCSYCVVPNTRGREISRPEESILTEVKNLVNLGAKEINLLGQNVDCYNGLDCNNQKSSLAKLIKKISNFNGVESIRYTTSYPSDFQDEMIELHRTEKKLAPLVYLPIQSGSDAVLYNMKRRYTRDSYLELINKLKSANPDIQISSDFIVGFPTETNDDFEKTLDIVKKVKFIQCYAFKYSPRPNTPAAKMIQIDDNIKKSRLLKLQLELRKIQDEFNKSCIGKTMKVLLLEKSKTDNNYLVGKNEYLQPVIVKADESLINNFVTVKITNGTYANLKGELI